MCIYLYIYITFHRDTHTCIAHFMSPKMRAKRAKGRPKRAKMRPNRAKRRAKMAKMRPKRAKRRPKRAKRRPKRAKRRPQEGREEPLDATYTALLMMLALRWPNQPEKARVGKTGRRK